MYRLLNYPDQIMTSSNLKPNQFPNSKCCIPNSKRCFPDHPERLNTCYRLLILLQLLRLWRTLQHCTPSVVLVGSSLQYDDDDVVSPWYFDSWTFSSRSPAFLLPKDGSLYTLVYRNEVFCF